MIFGVRGVQIRSKNRPKIDQKMKSSWEGILASIFHGFWSILEAKMAPSWGRKSIKNRSQKGIEKHMRKKGALGPSWAPPGPSWSRLGGVLDASWVNATAGGVRRYEGGDTLPGLIGYVYSYIAM